MIKKVIILTTFIIYIFNSSLSSKQHINIKKIISQYDYLELNKDNFYFLCEILEIQYIDIVYKQAVLESGCFKSLFFKKTNNMFGMKVPRRRASFAIQNKKTKTGYAFFYTWVHSLADYKLWQGNEIIREDYYEYLKRRNYAESKLYIKKLKGIK